jgi:hypothetical protein
MGLRKFLLRGVLVGVACALLFGLLVSSGVVCIHGGLHFIGQNYPDQDGCNLCACRLGGPACTVILCTPPDARE